eukprot:CAMPEP_0116155002 /NCGR_PEP_ID=MMETSP0329-20121206/22079_1 /TAXON_ID=697910 /ORGANISM="Pseudo-nitzschia arenysensis, Strain B593" /LENGTH=188 /DNA_ID=CAMNT_0003652015 /DNA_START=218 /DNA_END=784 /DNA_ORIENTATION=+
MFLTPSQKHDLHVAEEKVEKWVQKEIEAYEPKPQKIQEEPIELQKPNEVHEQDKEEPEPEPEPDPPETKKETPKETPKTKWSRWVEGEKALKKKLKILFNRQAKGQFLAAPVLTRYLGEEIPAYVGTPDSKLQEDEWKKLVDAKYQEMREEEEEWQKKMALFIEQQPRNPGITTTTTLYRAKTSVLWH